MRGAHGVNEGTSLRPARWQRPPASISQLASAARQPTCLPTVAGGIAGLVSQHCTRQVRPGGATLASCVLGSALGLAHGDSWPQCCGYQRQLAGSAASLHPSALPFIPLPLPLTPPSAPSTMPVFSRVRGSPLCPLHISFLPFRSFSLPRAAPSLPVFPILPTCTPSLAVACSVYTQGSPLTCLAVPVWSHLARNNLPHQAVVHVTPLQLWPAPPGSALPSHPLLAFHYSCGLPPGSALSPASDLHYRVAAPGLLPTYAALEPRYPKCKSSLRK